MDLGLRGKNAAVAGATRGIGRAIADQLAADRRLNDLFNGFVVNTTEVSAPEEASMTLAEMP